VAGHIPVLRSEVLALLQPRPAGRYLDATIGLGGHAEAILRASDPDGTLLGIDRDLEALARAQARLAPFGARLRLRHGRFEDLEALARDSGPFDGILFDLGASSLQLDMPERGFAFARGGPLDMRMDRQQPGTAADLVMALSEQELADLIYRWGEERWSRRIARAVVQAREHEPIRTTTDLAEIVARTIPRRLWPRHIHPATRTFQALRIAVNEELGGLDTSLAAAADLLGPGGRVVVISFHSLEDRIAKQAWRSLEAAGRVRVLTKRPLTASETEVQDNPRARSAKLRAVERAAGGA
jgi:16S rRNA (cytosine1402-N4)-methyltransferase